MGRAFGGSQLACSGGWGVAGKGPPDSASSLPCPEQCPSARTLAQHTEFLEHEPDQPLL